MFSDPQWLDIDIKQPIHTTLISDKFCGVTFAAIAGGATPACPPAKKRTASADSKARALRRSVLRTRLTTWEGAVCVEYFGFE